MKINKKVIIPALAVCMGAALVGSISGTVAWYQYSTRSQASMAAVTAGANKNLQISLDGEHWFSDLSSAQLKNWLEGTADATLYDDAHKNVHSDAKALEPITTGAMEKDDALPANFYNNPVYQVAEQSNWGTADDKAFIQIPFMVRYVEDNGTEESYPSKDIYLQDVTIVEKEVSGKKDISDAVRVHVAGTSDNALIANVAETATEGTLDLNGDGFDDKEQAYDFEATPADITYGAGAQKSYKIGAADAPFADDTNPYAIVTTNAMKIGTSSSEDGVVATVTIWLEGWQELENSDSTTSAIWNVEDYVGSAFNVGIRFCCAAE